MIDHRQNGGQTAETCLAEKLRREYRGRGENLRGVGAASTEELMRRAKMGRDPHVNVSEEAFTQRLNARERTSAYSQEQRIRNSYAEYPRVAPGNGTSRRSYSGIQNQRAHDRKNVSSSRAPAVVLEETRIERRSLPPFFILLLTFMTVMVLLILFSIAQIYKTTDEIGDLKVQLSTLQTTAAELELQIEEKNDIRTIEKIATEELGMVKEDSVQKKYVSLSDGEHIDLVENPDNETESGGIGTMLSSIFSALGKWFGGES